jgi:oxygen-dependent protoporphyrinogen oxidase
VGAGIAGLVCAHRLVTALGDAAEIVVLEASDRGGGLVRSEHIDGFLCESGPNGFLDNAPATLALVDELHLREHLVSSQEGARRRFVFRNGRLRLLPISPGAFLTSDVLSARAKLRIAREPFAPRRPEGDETVHAFAARRLGREAADILVDPMVSGIFAGDARQLSLRAAFPKIWELEEQHGGLFRALVARRRKRRQSGAPVESPLGRLTSFAAGMETLSRALVTRLGHRVRLHAPVSMVTPNPQTVRSWRIALESGETLVADQVVLTPPPPVTAALVRPLDREVSDALLQIPLAPIVVLALGFESATLGHSLDGFGFLVPRGQGPRILGALWESSVFPGRAEPGRALIRVMAGGMHDPAFCDLTDEQMLEAVRRDLRTTMGITAEPGMVRIIRHRAGIPQYAVGHLDRLARIDAGIARFPGLHLAGHAFRGVGINAVIADAAALAARIVSAAPNSA